MIFSRTLVKITGKGSISMISKLYTEAKEDCLVAPLPCICDKCDICPIYEESVNKDNANN